MNEDCRRTFAEVESYLDGDLAADACRRLEAHAAGCAPCAEAVSQLRRTIGMCRAAGHAPLPETVRARALAAVRRLLDGARGNGAAEERS